MKQDIRKPEVINGLNAWFDDYDINDPVRYRVANAKEFFNRSSFNSTKSDWNKSTGKEKGIFLHSYFSHKKEVVSIVGVTLQQRKKELSSYEEKNKWKSFIPQIYR